MAQNFQIATFANVVTTTTTGNVGINNSAPTDTLSINGTTYHSGNVKFLSTAGVQANGSYGTSGQFLTSNASGIYWSTFAVNTAATYTWTNTHTFNGNVVLGSGLSSNGSYGTAGQYLASNGSATYWTTRLTTGKSIAMAIVFGG